VVEATTQRPHEQTAIREALTALAPYVGLTARDAPVVILRTLEATIVGRPT